MSKKKLRILAQHLLLSDSLALALAEHYELTEHQPDVLVIDESLMRLGVVGPFLAESPGLKVIVIAGRGNGGELTGMELVEMIKAGAHAYARVSCGISRLINIIDLVLEDNVVWPSEALEGFRRPFRSEVLMLPAPARGERVPNFSPRERQLFDYICAGLSNKLIARETQIAEATVKVHIKAILRKLRLQNRTQAAVWAINNRSNSGE